MALESGPQSVHKGRADGQDSVVATVLWREEVQEVRVADPLGVLDVVAALLGREQRVEEEAPGASHIQVLPSDGRSPGAPREDGPRVLDVAEVLLGRGQHGTDDDLWLLHVFLLARRIPSTTATEPARNRVPHAALMQKKAYRRTPT